jgi:hypothetical protein
MIYATYSDFSTRYVTKLPAEEVSSHLLPFASARLEGALGPYFALPFGANNLTATDLTLDLAYLLVLQRSKEPGDASALAKSLEARLGALAGGQAAMITSSGELLYAQAPQSTVWASHGGRCRAVFDLGGPDGASSSTEEG